jgi:hypothetical protein
MSPRHARLLFAPSLEPSDNLTRSAVLPLPAMSNDLCNGRSAPDEMHVRDGCAASSPKRATCRAQLPSLRASIEATRQ